MTSNEIRATLVLKQITQTSIAKKIGVPVSLVNMVISGTEKTPRVRLAVAEAIGKPVLEIWPDTKMEIRCYYTKKIS